MDAKSLESVAEFFADSIQPRVAHLVRRCAFTHCGGSPDLLRECTFLVEVPGAQSLQQVLQELLPHLGQAKEITSQVERGNTLLGYFFTRERMFPEASGTDPLAESDGAWICTIGSVPRLELPEEEHFTLSEGLEISCQLINGFTTIDDDREELCQILQSVLRSAIDSPKNQRWRVCAYLLRNDKVKSLMVGLNGFDSLSQIRTLAPRIARATPKCNSYCVVDFTANPQQRACGWEGSYALLCGRTIRL